MVKAAKFVNDHSNCDIIDLNMGVSCPESCESCSRRRVIKNPNKIYEIVKEIKKLFLNRLRLR